MKLPTSISLEWTGELAFRVDASGGRSIVTDGNGKIGISPVEMLVASVAGCMAMDVVHILTRSRLSVDACRVRCTGERAQTEPHRLTRVHMAFELEGSIPQAQLDRALQLSRDKYCSVWNSLRADIPLDVTTSIGSRSD
jgi:putative redox protein